MFSPQDKFGETMRIALRLLVCTFLVCLCGCPFGTPRDHYRPPGHGDITIAVSPADDAILFNAVGSGGRDLFLLALSDHKVTRITDTPDYETAASFSPDGQWVVYAAGVPGDRADHLFKMQLDGSEKTQLTDIDANDTSPRFSPDGKQIVFARDKTYQWGGLAANWEPGGVICVMDADGTNLRQLTSDDDYAFEPSFTADGTRVVYSSADGRMLIAVDGTAAPQPVAGPAGAVASPDGKSIAFSKGKFSGDLKVVVTDADGESERVLTPNISGCYRPTFAHGGKRLFFLSEEWPNGPSGVGKFTLWETSVQGAKEKPIAGCDLFDNPLGWKPPATP